MDEMNRAELGREEVSTVGGQGVIFLVSSSSHSSALEKDVSGRPFG